jgi:RNA polymerase sigma-70 factor (ECF subfamily)
LEALRDREELALIRRAVAGDVDAYETLYRKHVGRVHAICLRISADADRAEDLTQEVFLRVWQKLDQFDGRSALSTWLYRLATNVAIDSIRREIRRSARETLTEDPVRWERPGPARSPETGMDLEAALALLPPGARAVFVLHDIEGFRHREIARMTGLAEGTSKAQLFRARRLLREKLR